MCQKVGGRVGEPEDLAETYLYLMRERFNTGAMIVVDGGSTLVNRMFIGAFQLGQRLRQLGQKSSFSNFFIVSLATANL
jgi:hypothetical protein